MNQAKAESFWFAERVEKLENAGARTRFAIAAALGLVCNLAFAPFYFFPAMALGLSGLVWLLDGAAKSERPMRAAFARAWVFAFFYFLGGLYWIYSSFEKVDGALIFMIPCVLALPALLALYWSFAAAIAIKLWRKGPQRIVVFALAIMAAEGARGHFFGGFPWNLPGYVWPAGGAVSQAAALVGIYGLSAITVLALAAPAALADRGAFGFRVTPVLAAALGLGLLWGAGSQRLAGAPLGPPGSIVVRVADAGFSQVEKWRPGNAYPVFHGYLDLINGAPPSHADVDIWPESAVPTLLLDEPDMLEELGAALGDRTLIVGTIRAEPRAHRDPLYYNSAVVLRGNGGAARIGQIYNKSHLVPFGEFIPLWRQIEPFALGLNLKALQEIGSGFEPGTDPARMVVPGAPPAVFLICYESIFPGLIPRGEGRPDWIVNVTNDAWFGAATGPYQHYNQARYRAIEEGLPLARAASGGVSAIIDPYGRALAETGLNGGVAEAALPPPLPPTLYARAGSIAPAIVFGLMLLLAMALHRRGQAKK